MPIRFHNYQILNFENSMLLGSGKGVNKITHKALQDALQEIKKIGPDALYEHQTSEILGKYDLNISEAIAYLKKVLPYETDARSPIYTQIVIFMKPETKTHFQTHLDFSSGPCKLTYEEPYADKVLLDDHKNTLFLIIEEQLDPEKLRPFYYSLASVFPTAGIMTGFFTPGFFTLTAPFIAEVGNPCLFCRLLRLQHYEEQRPGESAWTRLLAFASKSQTTVLTDSPTRWHVALAGLLARERVLKFTSTQSFMSQDSGMFSSTIDLMSGRILEESTSHWQLCDCLGVFPC